MINTLRNKNWKTESGTYNITEIHKLLKTVSETYQDDEGWVNAATDGNSLKRARPDFEFKAYGFSKLSDLFGNYTDTYSVLEKYKTTIC